MKTPKELEEVVRKYQNGEKECFDRLYELSYPYLYTCMIHVVKDEETVVDMLQETYLEISRSITQLKNAEDFLSWSSTIGNRKCYAYLKKQKDVLLRLDSEEEGQDFFESIPDDEAFIPETILQDQEKQRLMREIIDGLSDMQRLCIIGFYYREQSLEEIAEELEIPINTVKSHLNRAKAKIKEAVIVLDQEKGTRLYSIAPFMLLFLAKELEVCEAASVPEQLQKEIKEQGLKNSVGNGAKEAVKEIVKTGIRNKLLIGVILAAVVFGGAAAFIHYVNPSQSGSVETNAERAAAETEAVVESVLQTNRETGSEIETETNVLTQNETEAESQTTEESQDTVLAFDLSEYESFGNASGGVIPIKKDGLWGAVNYEKEEIVPCIYPGYWKMPNNAGYFVLTDNVGEETVYLLFAPDGTKVYEGTDEVVASGNFYTVRQSASFEYGDRSEGTVNYYDYDGNLVLSTTYLDAYATLLPVSGAYEGKTSVRHQSYKSEQGDIQMEEGMLYADGTVVWDSEIYQEEQWDEGITTIFQYPIGTPNHGTIIGNNRGLESGAISVYTQDHQQVFWFDISSMSYDGNRFVRDYNDEYDWKRFIYDGAWAANYGTKMVWVMNDKNILVDLSLADGSDEYGYIDADIIQAVYDDIVLDMNAYWLVKKGERWGYIDHEGHEMAMYDDATVFSDGYALVIESGEAYLINERFEKVEECGAAVRVTSFGELLGREEDNVLYLMKR